MLIEQAHEVLYKLHAFELCSIAGRPLILTGKIYHEDLEETAMLNVTLFF